MVHASPLKAHDDNDDI